MGLWSTGATTDLKRVVVVAAVVVVVEGVWSCVKTLMSSAAKFQHMNKIHICEIFCDEVEIVKDSKIVYSMKYTRIFWHMVTI